MDGVKTLFSKYNHDDALTTIALLALIVLSWREAAIDLTHFGESVAAIFAGHAARSWGNSVDKS